MTGTRCNITDCESLAKCYIDWSSHWLSGMQFIKVQSFSIWVGNVSSGKERNAFVESDFWKREEFSDRLPLSYALITH